MHIEDNVIGDVRSIPARATAIHSTAASTRARALVSDTVEGAIEAKDLTVEASARVIGDISYKRPRVVNCATLEGKVTRRVSTENLGPTTRTRLRLAETAQRRWNTNWSAACWRNDPIIGLTATRMSRRACGTVSMSPSFGGAPFVLCET